MKYFKIILGLLFLLLACKSYKKEADCILKKYDRDHTYKYISNEQIGDSIKITFEKRDTVLIYTKNTVIYQKDLTGEYYIYVFKPLRKKNTPYYEYICDSNFNVKSLMINAGDIY